MGPVVLLLASVISAVVARPGLLHGPLIALSPGAPIGSDGRVLDTPEVAVAKAEHAAAHLNEKLKLADEAIRSSGNLQTVVKQSSLVLVPGAPIGLDGKVLDTPEVAVAKAALAAAQVNERINLANEAARSAAADLNGQLVPVLSNRVFTSVVSGATVGPDGRVQDTPEVAAARAAHAAAQINERINLANEAARSSGALLTGPSLAVPLLVRGAPIGPDGRVQDTPEVAVAKAAHAAAHLNEKLNLATESAKSADVLAVAGPALAYGRLVY